MTFAQNHCTCVEQVKDGVHTYEYTGTCVECGKTKTVVVPAREMSKYECGFLMQDAMLSVSANDREFLLSGICGRCFDKMFSDPEDN